MRGKSVRVEMPLAKLERREGRRPGLEERGHGEGRLWQRGGIGGTGRERAEPIWGIPVERNSTAFHKRGAVFDTSIEHLTRFQTLVSNSSNLGKIYLGV